MHTRDTRGAAAQAAALDGRHAQAGRILLREPRLAQYTRRTLVSHGCCLQQVARGKLVIADNAIDAVPVHHAEVVRGVSDKLRGGTWVR